jgi:hypothetical protein
MAPYDELPAARRERIERVGVPLWQEDLWKEIIRATESHKPDEIRFMEMQAFDTPAASQYAATTPELLRWFDGYNEHQPSGYTVFPFGFLLSLQAKSRIERAKGLAVVFGVRLPRAFTAAFVSQALKASEGIAGLSAAMRGLIAARTAVMTAVAAIGADMRRMTRASAACRRLMTIPGVGQLTALAFVPLLSKYQMITASLRAVATAATC